MPANDREQSETGKRRVPFSPAALFDLFFRPQRFFTAATDFEPLPYRLAAAWCLGIALVVAVVNPNNVYRSWMWDYEWAPYWFYLLVVGFFVGCAAWWVGGWWYLVRLGWAGDDDASERMARTIYVYTDFAQSAPLILICILGTVFYPDFEEFWKSEFPWKWVFAAFALWSVFVSYGSARAVFNIKKGWALAWFGFLPVVAVVLAVGAVDQTTKMELRLKHAWLMEEKIKEKTSVDHQRRLAEQGDAEAQFTLGQMYESGQGVPADRTQAIAWYSKAVRQRHSGADAALNRLLAPPGAGLKEEEGLNRYRANAEAGSVAAQLALGRMYWTLKDFANAAKWLGMAAQQKDAEAQFTLGGLYLQGLGVPRDYARAMALFRDVAENTDVFGYTAMAQSTLGRMYEQGLGVDKDLAAAVEWYRKAADRREISAQQDLARIKRDHPEAVR